MAHTFSPDQHHKLDSPDRREILPPEKILTLTGLKPGDTMADVGAGIGYFSIPAVEIVGEKGRVFAVDISEDMLKHLWAKMTEENRDNIKLILSEKDRSGIPDNTADYLLLCTVLHEAVNPQGMLENMYRSIKPGGRCVVVEWSNLKSDKGPPLNDRIEMNDAGTLLEKAGFKQIEKILLNNWFYIIIAYK